MKCIMCGNESFNIDIANNKVVCQSCHSVYKLSDFQNTGSTKNSSTSSTADFKIEARKLCGYTGNGLDVVIPEGVIEIGGPESVKIEGFNVPSTSGPFANNKNIVSVILPKSLQTINASAFSGCTALKRVIFQSSVMNIPNSCFAGCTSLVDIQLPNSVRSIGAYAFMNCSSLTSIIIPQGVDKVAMSTFEGCTMLQKVEIPNSVTSIDDQAFFKCSALRDISIPGSLEKIGCTAFGYCSSLPSVTIPSTLKTLSSSVFAYCTSLVNVELPYGLQKIESAAFTGCTNLRSLSIPETVTDIGGVYDAGNSYDTDMRIASICNKCPNLKVSVARKYDSSRYTIGENQKKTDNNGSQKKGFFSKLFG